jgi:hypothetical protein
MDFKVLNVDGDIYIKASSGDGSLGNPFILHRSIATIDAGASEDLGTTTDVAVADGDGSVNAHTRSAAKTLDERLPVTLGQLSKANSLSVTGPTDPDPIVIATGTNTIGAAKNAGPNWTRGRTIVESSDVSSAVDLSVAPAGGQYLVLDSLTISVGSTGRTITVRTESDHYVLFKLFMAANTSFSPNIANGLKHPVADKKIEIIASGSGDVFATATYHSEA